jgi:3-deoxy-manno-octulosonate cytidylyltransferase (CMP-KDO synthetase)
MTAVIIPARLASTRLPKKPLRDINGKPMIQHVYEGCFGSELVDEVYVATEDEEIADAVRGFGGKVILTGKADNVLMRCSMAVEHVIVTGRNKVVVVQGDEPMVRYEMIDLVLRGKDSISCLIKPIEETEDPWNPNMVKAIIDKQNYFVYLSRAAIPGMTPEKHGLYIPAVYKQVCIMAFDAQQLSMYKKLEMGPLERAEGIDLLRYIEHGHDYIRAIESPYETQCVDTQEDLELVRGMMK